MTRFDGANTNYCYSPAALDALNAAYIDVCDQADIPYESDDVGVASILDHVAETLLAAFDDGKRGEELVTAACQGL